MKRIKWQNLKGIEAKRELICDMCEGEYDGWNIEVKDLDLDEKLDMMSPIRLEVTKQGRCVARPEYSGPFVKGKPWVLAKGTPKQKAEFLKSMREQILLPKEFTIVLY